MFLDALWWRCSKDIVTTVDQSGWTETPEEAAKKAAAAAAAKARGAGIGPSAPPVTQGPPAAPKESYTQAFIDTYNAVHRPKSLMEMHQEVRKPCWR